VYNARRDTEAPVPTPTPIPVEELPVIDTVTASLPDSTESSADESEPLIPISHRPLEIADTVTTIPAEDDVESDTTDADADVDEEEEEETDSDNEEDAGSEEEEENTVHSDEETEKPQREQNLAAQIPTEIMFLLFTVLILNFFNFLLTLTGARQCIRPF
jgi:hypothetical protein